MAPRPRAVVLDPRAYGLAVRASGLAAGELPMLAVHPWDLDGARRAGLRTGRLRRDRGPHPRHTAAPDLEAPDLPALAERLA